MSVALSSLLLQSGYASGFMAIGLHSPPQHDNRMRVKAPALTSCLFGTIVRRSSRTKREKECFTTLNISTSLVEETYLVAFISCWSCSFVLPIEATCLIRLGVFVAASKLTHGACMNLTILSPEGTSFHGNLPSSVG